jgi:hypothetical protein
MLPLMGKCQHRITLPWWWLPWLTILNETQIH